MTYEITLSMIKPEVVARNLIGAVYQRFEQAGLHIVAAKMVHLTKQQAEQFYAVHKGKPFFEALTTFMSSGPIMAQALAGENAILKNRETMGATDPKKAAPNTIRADFGESIDHNAVHGSDAPDTAAFEVSFFFKPEEIYSK